MCGRKKVCMELKEKKLPSKDLGRSTFIEC